MADILRVDFDVTRRCNDSESDQSQMSDIVRAGRKGRAQEYHTGEVDVGWLELEVRQQREGVSDEISEPRIDVWLCSRM